MAVRQVRYEGDPVLRVKCKKVNEISPRIKRLIDDMFDTMYDLNGVGLAAPQIGIVRRIVVIDDYNGAKYALINPYIVSEIGEQESREGCLSIPGYYGYVKRPAKIHVKALNENGEEIEIKATGMLANILSHELDHLDGILYKDKAYEFARLEDDEELSDEDE
ncbi:MAG TPA: peptide deformylase [Clostridia bacterium]|nr:peptide deformylase [Clostridia bacterium]